MNTLKQSFLILRETFHFASFSRRTVSIIGIAFWWNYSEISIPKVIDMHTPVQSLILSPAFQLLNIIHHNTGIMLSFPPQKNISPQNLCSLILPHSLNPWKGRLSKGSRTCGDTMNLLQEFIHGLDLFQYPKFQPGRHDSDPGSEIQFSKGCHSLYRYSEEEGGGGS